jgi:hypothetical protein
MDDKKAFLDAKIKTRLEAAERFRLNPAIYENLLWRPCTVNILMVADSFLFFSDENFGLSDLIGILKNENLGYVRFNITVAHRDDVTDIQIGEGNADISGRIKSFKFDDSDDFDPDAYDQVWLFAAERSRNVGGSWTNRLTDSELRVLTEFMNTGGGIFATGDHEDLGAAMGGFLPRVRQMRRWFFPDPGPNGEGLAPPFEGPGRFDTNRQGHDAGYQFNDQSDDIPQPIVPKKYSVRTGVYFSATFPHPVLCGVNGPIEVLPDHPHESQCTAAADPNATETLDGVTFTEFPGATYGGSRPLPEVIATSTVIGGHTTSGKSGTTVARTFGAISAYDGHRADVGRIVTDATWHHFININLTGADGTPGSKGLGFLATPAGQAVYEEVKAYFVNIALWISPKSKLRCMRNWGLYWVVRADRLVEVFDPAIRLGSARLVDYLVLGRHARDAIGKFAGQCQGIKWTWDFVLDEWPSRIFIDMGDPWRPRIDEDKEKVLGDLEPRDLVDLNWVADVALGGAIMALRENAFPLNQKTLDRFDEVSEEIVRKGARAALKEAIPFIERGLETMSGVARQGFRDETISKS